MKSYWDDKPLLVGDGKFSKILDTDVILDKTKDCKILLDYKVVNPQSFDRILEFINENYISSEHKLSYSKELFTFYCKDSMILEFYPKNKQDIVGYVIGKKKKLYIEGETRNSIEVNFLCLLKKLRNIGVSSYMISSLTKECILKYKDTDIAHYTICYKIHSPSFCTKDFYHRPLNVDKLIESRFFKGDIDILLFKKAFNSFNIDKAIKVEIFNERLPEECILDELYVRYSEYLKDTFLLYEVVEFKEFKESFLNKAFTHFIMFDKQDKVVSYFCIFKLDNVYIPTCSTYSSGVLYRFFIYDNLISSFEILSNCIYNDKIYDTLTFTDIFDVNYTKIKCIKGTGQMNYYLFNMKSRETPPYQNGLVTI